MLYLTKMCRKLLFLSVLVTILSISISGFCELPAMAKIAPGDKIRIRVLEQEELGGTYSVSQEGSFRFPLIEKDIIAEGLTYNQLAKELKEALEKNYFYKATVLVSSPGDKSYTPTNSSNEGGTIYVYGKVARQGIIKIPRGQNLTVSKAIIMAGGFDEFANKRQVKLIRKSPVTGESSTTILNMVDIIEKGQIEKDVEVQDGDTISVSEQFFNF